jgi:hypothetical protein
MGRKPINRYVDTSIAWVKDSEFRMFDVKVPQWLEVKIAIIENGQYNGTETHLVSEDSINGEEFVRKIKELGYKVLSVNHYTIQVPSICRQCGKEGTPKIEDKNKDKYRVKTGRYQIPEIAFADLAKITKTPKPTKPYLSYAHGSKEKHWLWEYVPFPQPHFKVGIKKIPIQDLFVPNRIPWLKRHFSKQ